MKSILRCDRYFWALATAIPLSVLAGCIEYTVETTLDPEGTGMRWEEMLVADDEDADFRVSEVEFQELMRASAKHGWRLSKEVEDDDTVHVFRRETRVGQPGDWDRLDGGIRILGTTGENVEAKVGHVRLGDVEFRNSISVEIAREPEARLYRYRETFRWTNILDAVVENKLEYFRSALDQRYPRLDAGTRGEVVGLVRGGLWEAVERDIFDMGDSERAEYASALTGRVAEQAARLVGRRYGDAQAAYFKDVLWEILVKGDDRDGAFLEKSLPGVMVAGNTEIVLRMKMPGETVDTNAHEREGSTLIWKFSPWDGILAPVEVYAESRLNN